MSLLHTTLELLNRRLTAGESEAPVADANPTTTPPAALTAADVQKLVADAVGPVVASALKTALPEAVKSAAAEAIKPFVEKLDAQESNLKVLADTVAKAPPASPDAVKALVAQQVTEQVAAARKAEAEAATKGAARQKVAEELKAKGVPDEIIASKLPADGDEAAFAAASSAAVARWNELGGKTPPANPGAAGDGGKTPGQGNPAADATKNAGAYTGLTPGVAAYASNLKLPNDAAAK